MATRSPHPETTAHPTPPPRTTAPHPVLQRDLGDYRQDCTFRTRQVATLTEPDSEHYRLELIHELRCPSLEQSLENHDAILITRTNCRDTHTRLTHTTRPVADTPFPIRQFIDLPTDNHKGRIEFQSFIVSDRHDFRLPNDDLNPTLAAIFPQGRPLPRGARLAVSEVPHASTEDTHKPVSILDIKADNAITRGTFHVSLDDHRIQILLHHRDFDTVQQIRDEPDRSATLYPSIYLAAIHQAVLVLGDPKYHERRWHQVLSRKAHELDPDFDLTPSTSDALIMAQKLLESPFARIAPPTEEDEEA